MTTLIGICSEDKSEVVLAADRQSSSMDKEGRIQYKQPVKKLYKSNDERVVLGTVGFYDDLTQNLVKAIIEGKIDIQKVISDRKFPQLLDINLERCSGKLVDKENSTGIIVATRFNSPELFTCFPMGCVEPRGELTYVGSGDKYVHEYLYSESIIHQARPDASIFEAGKVTPKVARELAYRSVRHAARFDPYSNWLDMTTVSAQGITEFGEAITKEEDKAQENILKILGIKQ